MSNIPLPQQNATPGFPRFLRAVLEEELAHTPVVAVMGARQVGKSTLCRQLADARGMTSVTLDDVDVLAQAHEDPAGLLASLGGDGAFIDEVQRAPELLLAIKGLVDRDGRPGRYLLSGSNQPSVSRGVGDSLLGRAAYRTLRPLALGELRYDPEPAWALLFESDDKAVLSELERRAEANGPLVWTDVVVTGGFPRAIAAVPGRQRTVLDDYVNVFVTRDIREVLAVESPERFEALLRLVATRTGHPLNRSSLAVDAAITVSTASRWLDALQRSFLTHQVPPYSRNQSQRLIKSPKLFMVDSGLALAAARAPSATGFHLETLVANDLAIWRDLAPRRAVYHWRLSSGPEVDFVLEQDGALVPVEVTAASVVSRDDARHLWRFGQDHQSLHGVLLSGDPAVRALGRGLIAAPWWAMV